MIQKLVQHVISSQPLGYKKIRLTPQRKHVLSVLLESKDHPNAEMIFNRAKLGMPYISLATVYNCLEFLGNKGLIQPVQIDREPTRYCANIQTHAHFYCKDTQQMQDIDIPPVILKDLKTILPKNIQLESIDIIFNGSYISSLSK